MPYKNKCIYYESLYITINEYDIKIVLTISRYSNTLQNIKFKLTMQRHRPIRSKTSKICNDIEETGYGKIIIFGEKDVGKTSLVYRLMYNYFTEQYMPTFSTEVFDISAYVECESDLKIKRFSKKQTRGSAEAPARKSTVKKVVSVNRSDQILIPTPECKLKCFKCEFIDTSPDITQMQPITYRANVEAAHGFILVCSFDIPDSLEYIKSICEDVKKMRVTKRLPMIIVVNKSDLLTEETTAHSFEKDVEVIAENSNTKYCKVSMLTGEGIKLFKELIFDQMNIFDVKTKIEASRPDEQAFLTKQERRKMSKSSCTLM